MRNKLDLIKKIIQVIEEEVALTEKFHLSGNHFCPEDVYFDVLRYVVEMEECIPEHVSELVVYLDRNNMITACKMKSTDDVDSLEIQLCFIDK